MAATFTVMGESGMRGRPINMVKVDLDSSYATNGYAVTSHDCGLAGLTHAVIMSACKQGYIIEWEGLTKSIRVFRVSGTSSPLAEVPAGTDLSGISVDIMAVGG